MKIRTARRFRKLSGSLVIISVFVLTFHNFQLSLTISYHDNNNILDNNNTDDIDASIDDDYNIGVSKGSLVSGRSNGNKQTNDRVLMTTRTRKNDDELKKSAVSSIDNPDYFQWNFIDPSTPGTCGFNKCFFRSSPFVTMTNTTTDKNVSQYFDFGFLIAHNTKDCNLTLGWEMAKHLQHTYGLKHLYDSSPIRIPVSERLVEYTKEEILTKVKSKFYAKVSIKEFVKRLEQYPTQHNSAHTFFEVQRVRIPKYEPVLEWGDNRHRNQKCRREFSKFVAFISDKKTFARNLLRDIETLDEVLKKEAWILDDFQVLIDQKGNILHIDLDRKSEHLSMSARKLERKHKFAIHALRVILYKVITSMKTSNGVISKDDLSEARKYLEPSRKKIC